MHIVKAVRNVKDVKFVSNTIISIQAENKKLRLKLQSAGLEILITLT